MKPLVESGVGRSITPMEPPTTLGLGHSPDKAKGRRQPEQIRVRANFVLGFGHGENLLQKLPRVRVSRGRSTGQRQFCHWAVCLKSTAKVAFRQPRFFNRAL